MNVQATWPALLFGDASIANVKLERSSCTLKPGFWPNPWKPIQDSFSEAALTLRATIVQVALHRFEKSFRSHCF